MTSFSKYIITTGLLCINLLICAQQAPRYWNDIVAFKHIDSTIAIPKNPILFIGSSSFTNWQTITKDFSDYPILNRAFGGALCTDIIRYFYDIVQPYQPKQIVIYCGDNDLGFFHVTPKEFLTNFETLLSMIRVHFPNVEVCFVSIKPSPFHRQKQDSVKKANALIRSFLKKQPHTQYIDTYTSMLNKEGGIRKDIFIEDSLHMNKKGYELWHDTIHPYLKK